MINGLWNDHSSRVSAIWFTNDGFDDEISGTVVQGFDGKFYPILDEASGIPSTTPVTVRCLTFNNNTAYVYLCDTMGVKYDTPIVDIRR